MSSLLRASINPTILFVTHKYPPSTGGMQKQSFELIEHISKVSATRKIIFKSNYPKVFFFLTVSIRVLFLILTDKSIKLVHANDGLMALFLTPLLFWEKQVKLCATIHGLDVVFNVSIYQSWVRKFLAKFSFLIAVSNATKEECVRRGIAREKVYYIPNAVELPDKIEKDPLFPKWLLENHQIDLTENFIISSVGRPVPRKGFGWFADSVLPKLANTKYLVIGTEMESRRVILAAKRLLSKNLFEKVCKMMGVPLDTIRLGDLTKNQKSNLALLGKISYEKLIQCYLHSDLFVMPNLSIKGDFEGFGLVALEAGSLGTVCLAADVDGIPSAIMDNKNGFLLPSKKVSHWVDKIIKLQNKSELEKAKQMISAYFEEKQNTWEDMGDHYLKLFYKKIEQ